MDLLDFRASHPLRRVTVDGIEWEYLVGGGGPRAVVLAPGGLGAAEVHFRLFTRLQTIRQLATGVVALPNARGWRSSGSKGPPFDGWPVRRTAESRRLRAESILS